MATTRGLGSGSAVTAGRDRQVCQRYVQPCSRERSNRYGRWRYEELRLRAPRLNGADKPAPLDRAEAQA
jgi:hypothetical protein